MKCFDIVALRREMFYYKNVYPCCCTILREKFHFSSQRLSSFAILSDEMAKLAQGTHEVKWVLEPQQIGSRTQVDISRKRQFHSSNRNV